MTTDRLKAIEANLKAIKTAIKTAVEKAVEKAIRTAVEKAVEKASRTLQNTPSHSKTGEPFDRRSQHRFDARLVAV